jgi:hypothetical protein
MKKIVFVTIPMQVITPVHYAAVENKAVEYDGKVMCPIDSVLAKVLKKGDDVKVVQIITEGEGSDSNAAAQRTELENINKSIGSNLSFDKVVSPFKETCDIVELRFKQIVEKLEDDCEIFADMTYGPKTLTPVLFYALSFAEKFFDADIKHIVYGKIVHNKNKESVAATAELYDVTPLFYLNSLASVMSAPDSKTALDRLNKFLSL